MAQIIECVPNFSEGRRKDVIEKIVAPIKSVKDVTILDVSSDEDHNRTVLTLVGNAESLKTAILELFKGAVEHIDLRNHEGGHPRMGAVDVVPFIPIRDVTMEECVEVAKDVAAAISENFNVPTYLYEEAAQKTDRKNLATVRKGQFEGFAEKIKDPNWAPDFGNAEIHESAGATAVCARMPLIAYNVNLGTSDLEIATHIGKAVRHLSGGLRFVKAMGVMLEDRNIAQVSMNLTNYKKTPIYRVQELIKIEAQRWGVPVIGAEIVGLIPNEALLDCAAYYLQVENFTNESVLELRLD